MKQKSTADIITSLTSFFENQTEVAFAFLFGSVSRESHRVGSDIDVGVYFYPQSGELEIEEELYYGAEARLWGQLVDISGMETDLVVLNRAPARLVYTVLSEGVALSIADRTLYLRVLLSTGSLFEEYGEFIESFSEVKARSGSLSTTDKERLIRIIDFLETELEDVPQFRNLSYQMYTKDSALRRNVERWVENLVNASIDAAKVIIASEKQPIPQTYRESLTRLKTIEVFSEPMVECVAGNTRLRNILAHEYIDIRYKHIERFITTAEQCYLEFSNAVKEFIRVQTTPTH